jgi:ABC-type lipoprotein release transport system permease subunit
MTAALAAAVLLIAAAVGTLAPTRQAVRVDPAAVLRGD